MTDLGLKSGIYNWFGHAINPYTEPWYRFGRVIMLVERHMQIPAGARWLDVGCQIGQFLKLLQEKYQIIATGIDNFEESNVVEVCRRYFQIEIKEPSEVINESWRYLFRWVDKVGFNIAEKFSFISALEVLEHMVDTDAFLEECHEHLAENGYLVISTPNINSLRNRVQVPFGVYPAGMEYKTRIHHVRLYNVPTLKSHLKEHRFQVVGMTGVNFLPARFLMYRMARRIDARLSDLFPSLCGNIIVIARAQH